MAPRGRPPKPIEVKRRNGNPGKRRLPATTTALAPVTSRPRLPTGLATAGKAAWATLWEGGRTWLSPQIDGVRVLTVCRLLDEAAQLRALVAKHGLLLTEPITTPTGLVVGERLVANPAAKMLRDVEKQLDKELSALGFDPTARSRLGLAEVKKQSILDRLLEQPKRTGKVIDVEIVD